MRKLFFIISLFSSLLGWSQLPKSDFYLIGRYGIGMGMSEYNYNSTVNGSFSDAPKTIKLDMGSGLIPELGLGINLKRNLYVEYSISYFFNNSFFKTSGSTQGYSFNRFSFNLNGKYFVEINSKIALDFSIGGSYYIPNELTIQMYGIEEKIKYIGNVGMQVGFGGSFILKQFLLNGGIRYRYESYSKKTNQPLPPDFNEINPHLEFISSNGIDVVFSVIYHF